MSPLDDKCECGHARRSHMRGHGTCYPWDVTCDCGLFTIDKDRVVTTTTRITKRIPIMSLVSDRKLGSAILSYDAGEIASRIDIVIEDEWLIKKIQESKDLTSLGIIPHINGLMDDGYSNNGA